jgi:uncharacterized protein
MRTSEYILSVAIFGLGLSLTAAYALDGTKSPNALPSMGVGVAPEAPLGADAGYLKAWARAVRAGDLEGAVKSLQDAARSGDIAAAWKLGRMYADGDGVKQDDQKAFEYFRGITESRVEELTGTPRARFVANALVALGLYYLSGVPNSDIKPDPLRAYQKFYYAASYFGDSDAQYRLGRMYLDGQGVARDTKQAVRWLNLAATKGQYEAQAVFGSLLFKGQIVTRDGAKGLMWLRVAKDAASAKEIWILDLYNTAWKQATDDERGASEVHLIHWREQAHH